MNKETKRTLTAEMVKARLIHGAQIAIIDWLRPALIAMIYFWLPAFLAYYWLRVRLPWAAPIAGGILASVPFVILLIGAVTVCRAFYMICTGKFFVVRDKLCRIGEFKPQYYLRRYPNPPRFKNFADVFCFFRHGRYITDESSDLVDTYYNPELGEWVAGVKTYSCEGDEFYLVCYDMKKPKIAAIYNTRIYAADFEIKEEIDMRERLTTEKIREDLKYKAKCDLIDWVTLFVLAALLFGLLAALAYEICATRLPAAALPVTLVLLLPPIFVLGYGAYTAGRKFAMINRGEFSVVTDKLSGLGEDEYNMTSLHNLPMALLVHKYKYRTVNAFYFAGHDRYIVTDGGSVFDYSAVGDTFYLVIYNSGDETPVVVYNAKVYEYSGGK